MRLPGLLATAALIACLLPGSAWAQSGADARFEALERRIQQLEERLAERDAAMAEKEQALAKLQAKVAVQEQTAADIRAEVAESGVGGWTDGLEIGGAVEVLVSHDSPYEGNSTSNNETDTVEVALAAGIGDYASAELVLEKDDEDKVEVADAFFTIDSGAGVSFSAGKMGLPFADFETNLVSDPMALEIGEAVKNALMLSFESEAGFSASAYTFNGDADYNGRDRIDKVGAQAGFGTELGGMGVDLGIGWINDFREADSMEGSWPEEDEILESKKVAGLAVSGGLSFGPLSFLGHYVSARDKLGEVGWAADVSAHGSPVTKPLEEPDVEMAQPSAWGVEMGYAFEAAGRRSAWPSATSARARPSPSKCRKAVCCSASPPSSSKVSASRSNTPAITTTTPAVAPAGRSTSAKEAGRMKTQIPGPQSAAWARAAAPSPCCSPPSSSLAVDVRGRCPRSGKARRKELKTHSTQHPGRGWG